VRTARPSIAIRRAPRALIAYSDATDDSFSPPVDVNFPSDVAVASIVRARADGYSKPRKEPVVVMVMMMVVVMPLDQV
jgi:hypothetical protein